MAAKKNKRRNLVVGLGLDEKSKRTTVGQGYLLHGGKKETHEGLEEAMLRTDEDLRRKGETIPDAEPERLKDSLQRNIEDVFGKKKPEA